MIPMTLAAIADVVGGRLAEGAPGDRVVSAPAYVDSRTPERQGLFVALVGQRSDGHDHAAGAHAVLGTRPTAAPTVVVPDAVAGLARLAGHVVDRLVAEHGLLVLAVTGSQGKTGTKDFLAHVLAAAGPTVATPGNLNNQIGVPLTVLRAESSTRYLVVEMGARGVGNIAELRRIVRPVVAAVLNVGTAHLSEFGTREAIATAKGEIVEALPAAGTAVLNTDDDLVRAMAERTRARVLGFGHLGEVGWEQVELDELGRPRFALRYAGASRPVRLRLPGRHQVANATAAAAMALAAGLDLSSVAASLDTARTASPWRMELVTRRDGMLVVNDAYNANPASMAAAVDTLAAIGERQRRRTVAVLGEMLELGAESDAAHREVGRAAAAAGVDVLVTVGPAAAAIGEGARLATGWHGVAVAARGRDEALGWLRDNARADDVVLVKASRGVALEHVAEALLADLPDEQPGTDPRENGATGG